MSWAALARLRRIWGVLQVCLGAYGSIRRHLGGVLGPSWGVLGGSWEGFGQSGRLPGSFLGVFLKDFLQFCAICGNSKKPTKTSGVSLIFEVPWRFWGSKNP